MQTRHFAMSVSRLALVMSMTLAGTAALAAVQDTIENTAHHPAADSSAPKTMPAKTGASKPARGMDSIAKGKMDQMEGHMKIMRDMHQKFMAAKTSEERNALMPEHMQAMEDAMIMMQGMSGMGMMGDMAARQQMMEKRMEMMQSMMQMMMDRIPVENGK